MNFFLYIITSILFSINIYSDFDIISLDVNKDNYSKFESNKFKFTIFYPINWKHIPNSHKDTIFKVGGNGYLIMVNVKNNDGLIIDELSSDEFEEYFQDISSTIVEMLPSCKIISKKQIYVNNHKAMFMILKQDFKSVTYSGEKLILSTIITSNKYSYTISGQTNIISKTKEFLDIYNEILSTFVFHIE